MKTIIKTQRILALASITLISSSAFADEYTYSGNANQGIATAGSWSPSVPAWNDTTADLIFSNTALTRNRYINVGVDLDVNSISFSGSNAGNFGYSYIATTLNNTTRANTNSTYVNSQSSIIRGNQAGNNNWLVYKTNTLNINNGGKLSVGTSAQLCTVFQVTGTTNVNSGGDLTLNGLTSGNASYAVGEISSLGAVTMNGNMQITNIDKANIGKITINTSDVAKYGGVNSVNYAQFDMRGGTADTVLNIDGIDLQKGVMFTQNITGACNIAGLTSSKANADTAYMMMNGTSVINIASTNGVRADFYGRVSRFFDITGTAAVGVGANFVIKNGAKQAFRNLNTGVVANSSGAKTGFIIENGGELHLNSAAKTDSDNNGSASIALNKGGKISAISFDTEVGDLNAASLAAGAGTIQVDIASESSYDKIILTGAFNKGTDWVDGDKLLVDFIGGASLGEGAKIYFAEFGSTDFTADDFTASGLIGEFKLDAGGKSFYFEVGAIPEPSEVAALLGLVVLGFAAYRRRK